MGVRHTSKKCMKKKMVNPRKPSKECPEKPLGMESALTKWRRVGVPGAGCSVHVQHPQLPLQRRTGKREESEPPVNMPKDVLRKHP